MKSGCVICYDSFDTSSYANNAKKSDEVRIVATVCGHVFHNKCIQEWLKQSHTCPECRMFVRKGNLSKLFINFCIDNKSDNNADESLNALQEQLCAKDLECVEKDKEIIGLQIDCSVSERKIRAKDEKINELQTSFAHSEVQILQKDKKIKELQACFDRSEVQTSRIVQKIKELQTSISRFELESLEKDEKIKELETSISRFELESLEKDEKIKELETSISRFEKESLEKDEKIKELQTNCVSSELEISKKSEELPICFANSERDVKKMLQQQMELNNEISGLKQELQKLKCVEAENEKLLQEKNTLQSEKNILVGELEYLNTVKTILEGSFIDVKKVLADVQVHVSSDSEEGKAANCRIATYCSLLKQELADSPEEKTRLQNELTKLKQELVHSEEEKTQVPNELKPVKHRMRTRQSDSRKRTRQHVNSSKNTSMSVSCGPSPVPIIPSVPSSPSQCSNLAKSTLVSSPSCNSSSDCKNELIPVSVNFSENKRQKISIVDFIKKYSMASTESPETPVLTLAIDSLS